MNRETAILNKQPEVTVEPGFAPAIDEVVVDERHLFLRRAWFAGAGGEQPRTLVGRRPGGELLAALPLIDTGPRWLGFSAIPGSYWPFRCAPVAQDASEEELAALLSAPTARRALGRAWRLGPVLDNDAAAMLLTSAARRAGYRVLARRTASCFALDLAEARREGPWPKPSTLRNINKQKSKLARLGAIDFRFVSGGDWNSDVLDVLAAIERSAWAGNRAGADPKFVDPARRRGWETAIADPKLAAMLSVGILSIGGEPAAFSFGIDCGRTRFAIAKSYDARFAKQSAGYLTAYWTYMKAAERGGEWLSLGAGDGGEKSSMGAKSEGELMDYLFVRGAALAAALRPLWR
jgi:CelD/BcsL family acetyltransferase involved in cellulose biosynthesis